MDLAALSEAMAAITTPSPVRSPKSAKSGEGGEGGNKAPLPTLAEADTDMAAAEVEPEAASAEAGTQGTATHGEASQVLMAAGTRIHTSATAADGVGILE
jgi:hypothetical protein